MLRIFVIFVYIFIFCAGTVVAQSDDWGVWSTVDFDKKINKRWNATVGGEYRWQEGMAKTDQIRGNFGVSYNPKKIPVKFGAGYTLIANKKQKKDIFIYRNRFQLEATGSYKFYRFTASWRSRLQATFYDSSEKKGGDEKWVMRNRLGLKYNIRKTPLKPYIQFEFFNRIFSDLEPSYYKNRFSTGIDINVGKHHELDLGYKQENKLSGDRKFRFDVCYVGYTFMF